MNAITNMTRRATLWSACLGLALATAPVDAQEETVEVTDYGTVTLTVKDTDLAQVLEMLAIQSRKNIIASNTVSASVSANLYDVTFYEALDSILRVNGFGYIEEGNFIYVYSQAELEEIERLRRQTDSRVYVLEFLSASDAHEFIQPLLSEDGQSAFRGDVQPGFMADVADGGADGYAWEARLVVNDYVENLDAIEALLQEVDTSPQQVLVEATILQTTLDEANAFGIDFAFVSSLDFLDLANPLSGVTNLLDGNDDGPDVKATSSSGFVPGDNRATAGASTVGNTQGPGGFKLGIIREDFTFFLKLLDEVTDSTVLARPKIMCLNRQRAEVLVGARVGYLSTTATETTTTQTVEFLDTGIQLVFRPFISRNGMVRLELAPSVSEASLRTITDASGLIVTIPDEITNELTTNVRVPDGQTLVLGGLFRESTRVSRRQVPFLGDIPLLGYAFRGQDDTVDRDEIIFLITPSIIEDDVLAEIGDDTLEYTEQARIGAREELLGFSREKLTSSYNQEAIAAYQGGDVERALYHINNSLRLNPNQPSMQRFRQQVSGAREPYYEHSVLDRVLDREIKEMGLNVAPIEVEVATPIIAGPTAFINYPVTMPQLNQGPVAADMTAPVVAQPIEPEPLTIEQQEFYDELFKSFFESLGLPELSPVDDGSAALEHEPAVEFPFETFDDLAGVTDMPSSSSNITWDTEEANVEETEVVVEVDGAEPMPESESDTDESTEVVEADEETTETVEVVEADEDDAPDR